MSRRIDLDGDELVVRFPFDLATKDAVKAVAGSRWDAFGRVWRFPVARAAAVVEALAPLGFVAAPPVLALVGGADGPAPVAPPRDPGVPAIVEERGAVGVRALNDDVARVLREQYPAAIWVIGELQNYRVRTGRHAYFDLVERDGAQDVAASVPAVLFANARERVERRAERAGIELQDGARVMLQARVEMYARTGRYQLVVDDIEPAYTVGEAVARREQVLAALRAEGLATRNLSLPMPRLPLRIALVTSRAGDAYHDFTSVLAASGYAFRVTVFDARVQGDELERTVLAALSLVDAHAERFDVCVITRGGGSRVELAGFDNLAVARAVARLRVKAVVAIGHEQDRSALDEIAESRRTPTDAAKLFETLAREAEVEAEYLGDRIEDLARGLLADALDAVGGAGLRLQRVAERRLARERLRVETETGARIRAATRARLGEERGRVGRARALLTPARLRRATQRAREREQGIARAVARAAAVASARESTVLRQLERELRRRSRARAVSEAVGLDALEARCRLLDPARVLARGYAIVSRLDGGVVARAEGLAAGDQVGVRFADGTVRARLESGPGTED
jgi:exodeoxyribonuclease VII large subunit